MISLAKVSEVRQEAKYDAIIDVLTKGLSKDPLHVNLLRNTGNVTGCARTIIELAIELDEPDIRLSYYEQDDKIIGACIWKMPSPPSQLTIWQTLSLSVRYVLQFGLCTMIRMLHVNDRLEEAEAKFKKDNDVTLKLIVIDPEAQGKGIGSQILTESLNMFRKNKEGCYLEATNHRNRDLYSRFGFSVCDEVVFPELDGSLTIMRTE